MVVRQSNTEESDGCHGPERWEPGILRAGVLKETATEAGYSEHIDRCSIERNVPQRFIRGNENASTALHN